MKDSKKQSAGSRLKRLESVWTMRLSDAVPGDLKKLDKSVQRRLLAALGKLETLEDPRPSFKSLKGGLKGLRRYKVGAYRIIALLDEKRHIILVLAIMPRKDDYGPRWIARLIRQMTQEDR